MGKRESGGKTSTSNNDAAAAFWNAIEDENLEAVKRHLPSIHPKRDRDILDRALSNAVYADNVKLVDLLLSAGADPDPVSTRDTPLMSAAGGGKLEIVKRLIKAGADYNRQTKEGTALSEALCYKQIPVVKYLEKLKAYSPPTRTLLYACMRGDVARAKRAIQQGAKLDVPGGIFEDTPLMAAAGEGHLAIVKVLLQHGANPNKKISGKTALFDAVQHGKNLEVFDTIVKAGADIRAKYYDETLLMCAAKSGHLPTVKRLVELGANINSVDKSTGCSALDYAIRGKHKEITSFLSGRKANSARDGARTLIRELAKRFGGKVMEHSQGYLLNSRLGENKCQFETSTGVFAARVHRLKFGISGPQNFLSAPIFITPGDVGEGYKGYRESKAASVAAGIPVYWKASANEKVDEKALISFCLQLKPTLPSFNLTAEDRMVISRDAIKYGSHNTSVENALAKLSVLTSLLKAVTRPPEPDRSLFKGEWLIKQTPKSAIGKKSADHKLGGTSDTQVACPQCGAANNQMIRLDLSDPKLPSTPLGRKPLPLFWCMQCLEWDPVFYDISGSTPSPLLSSGKNAIPGKIEEGEDDLPEQSATIVALSHEKKAGHKSKVGGSPFWIQSEQTPDCPKCEKPMPFLLQLDSDSRISFCDMGLFYAFACPECKVAATFIQSH